MPCYYYPDRDPIAGCVECGRLVCAECAMEENERTLCRKCYERRLARSATGMYGEERKDPVVAALLSIIPGMGQMYNGEVAKGLILLFIFIVLLMWMLDLTPWF